MVVSFYLNKHECFHLTKIVRIYDEIRSTHYKKVYKHVEEFEESWKHDLEDMARNISANNIQWITNHDAKVAFAEWVKDHPVE